jgi:hypothetical protein
MGLRTVFLLALATFTFGLKTIHVVPHSHCDTGWIEPIDWYYHNKVIRILGNMVDLLDQNPARRFVWSETSFFKRWFESMDFATQTKIHQFVEDG